tara:strand:+ start:320 stop:628 length:309 start_codon:yes stop_codon:yes gene_type:complete
MITIIEIPHQRLPLAWVTDSYSTACDLCASISDKEVEGSDRDSLLEFLDDNQRTIILEDADDWREFFTNRAPNHQRWAAQKEARKIIRYLGQGSLCAGRGGT